MKKKNFLLIIGNGFDMELGLKTGFRSFVESPIYEKYEKEIQNVHIPADTRSAFSVISVHSPVSIQYRWQS